MSLGASVHGWLILDKPLGMTSTRAVTQVKQALRRAGHGRVKVGHGGTLDPLASGVLPIAIGEATKLAGRLLDATKTYAFTIAFGAETDTLDLEGAVVATSDHRPAAGALAAVLGAHFTGAIEQVPPAFSALKVDGARAYARARAGEVVALASRRVTIHRWDSCEDIRVSASDERIGEAMLTVTVSKGTYIRSLARDIALALGTRGHVTRLRRLAAGPFALRHAISLDMLEQIGQELRLESILLPLEVGLDDIPALELSPEQASAVRKGQILTGLPHSDGLYRARHRHALVALMRVSEGLARVERGFNLPDVAEQLHVDHR